MIEVIELSLAFLEMFLATNGQKLPADVVASVRKSIEALKAHRNDLLTKANFEAQRG